MCYLPLVFFRDFLCLECLRVFCGHTLYGFRLESLAVKILKSNNWLVIPMRALLFAVLVVVSTSFPSLLSCLWLLYNNANVDVTLLHAVAYLAGDTVPKQLVCSPPALARAWGRTGPLGWDLVDHVKFSEGLWRCGGTVVYLFCMSPGLCVQD